jgi:hypothetical protein
MFQRTVLYFVIGHPALRRSVDGFQIKLRGFLGFSQKRKESIKISFKTMGHPCL